MLTTCFAILAVALHAGDVFALPDETRLVAPGRLNWALGDPTFLVPGGPHALVVRVAPERTAGVVEIRLFDGTHRLGWLEDVGLTSVRADLARRPIDPPPPAPDGASVPRHQVKGYGVVVDPRFGRRHGHAPDFAAVDAMVAGGLGDQVPSGPGGAGPSTGEFRSPWGGSHLCGKPNQTKDGTCQRRVADGAACPLHGY